MNIDRFIAESSTSTYPSLRLTAPRTCVRVLPRKSDPDLPFVEVYRHFLQDYITVPNFIKAPQCLLTPECPGCELASRLAAKGNSEAARRVSAKRRFVVWVIDRTPTSETNGKICTLEVSPSTKEKFVSEVKRWHYDFVSLDSGCVVEILRVQRGRGADYDVKFVTQASGDGSFRIAPDPLSEEELREYENLPDLEEYLASLRPSLEDFRRALDLSPIEEPLPFSKEPEVVSEQATISSQEVRPTTQKEKVAPPDLPECFGSFGVEKKQCATCPFQEACLTELMSKGDVAKDE